MLLSPDRGNEERGNIYYTFLYNILQFFPVDDNSNDKFFYIQ